MIEGFKWFQQFEFLILVDVVRIIIPVLPVLLVTVVLATLIVQVPIPARFLPRTIPRKKAEELPQSPALISPTP
jgi:hypothetical protein